MLSDLEIKIYQDIENIGFSNKNMIAIGKKYNLSLHYIKKIVEHVFREKYHKRNTTIEMKNTFVAFINFTNHYQLASLKKAIIYYQSYADNTEKEEFKTKFLLFIRTTPLTLIDARYFYNIYEVCELISINAEEKERIYSLFEPFYQLATKVNWQLSPLKLKAEELNMSYENYLILAKTYAKVCLHILDINDKIYTMRYQVKIPKGKNNAILEKILIESDPKNLDVLFSQLDGAKNLIANYCYSRNRNFTPQKRLETEQILMQKLQDYRNRKKALAKEKRELQKEAKKDYYDKIIQAYCESSLTLEEFCASIPIAISSFQKLIKNYNNHSVLELVQKKIDLEQKQKEEEKRNIIRKLIYYLQNGIEENGTIREFDLIDYFVLFPNCDFHRIHIPHTILNRGEETLIESFFAPIKLINHFDPTKIINQHFELIKTNEDHSITNIIVSKEILEQIVIYFQENNIPKSTILFNIALKRYINHTLNLKDNLQEPNILLK